MAKILTSQSGKKTAYALNKRRKALADYANCEAQTDKVIIAVAIHRNGSARLL
ncbi:hypothetical protein Ahy_A09g045708 isoform F [Arachis hypogaea]|uniref:Uncharacterized protein n=1 Tax=Arachis hypogaea TaxID=3818 RepID=A0A445BN10_ARAHY|nr:hypothetical protein Ahy_A09g045708 isoform F [Arachis hypogaea]